MSQPGTTANDIKRGDDWIARELADLRRQLRRAVAATSQGGAIGAVRYQDVSSHSATRFFLDPSLLLSFWGDVSWASYDASEPGIMISAPGTYFCSGITGGGPASLRTRSIGFMLEPPGVVISGNVTAWLPPDVDSASFSAPGSISVVTSVPDWVDAEIVNPDGLTFPAFGAGDLYVVKLA